MITKRRKLWQLILDYFKLWKKEVSYSNILILEASENIRITSIQNAHSRGVQHLSASSSQITAISLIVMNSGLGKHSIVLNLGLSQRRAVGSNKDQLSYALPPLRTQTLSATQTFQNWFVSELKLSASHDKLQLGVNAISVLLLKYG